MHIFKYSMRSGTPAAAMPDQIDPQIKERRAKQMADVAQKNKLDYERRFVGQTLRILVEEQTKDGLWTGHSSNYLLVTFPRLRTFAPAILSMSRSQVLSATACWVR